jgi:hypothetical protein
MNQAENRPSRARRIEPQDCDKDKAGRTAVPDWV